MSDTQLKKRIKSFLWRIGVIAAVGGLSAIAENLGVFNLSPEWIVVVGGALGEVTKWLNNIIQGK